MTAGCSTSEVGVQNRMAEEVTGKPSSGVRRRRPPEDPCPGPGSWMGSEEHPIRDRSPMIRSEPSQAWQVGPVGHVMRFIQQSTYLQGVLALCPTARFHRMLRNAHPAQVLARQGTMDPEPLCSSDGVNN